jgi:hypothetical protein
MKRFVLGLITAVCFAGCVAVVESQPIRLTAAQAQQIQGAMAYNLFDPGSAQFRNIRAADVTLKDGNKERRVCGEINGKNRFGAYVGFQMFGGKMVNGKFVQNEFFGPCEPWSA